MKEKTKTIEDVLHRTYQEYCSSPKKKDEADFVFHMTDWSNDLSELAELYKTPTAFTERQAKSIISNFLSHARWHISEAGRLLSDEKSPFRQEG